MGRNFGGLGAWGMFMALIAVFALAFTGPDNDSRKKYDDATQAFNWTTEPAPPLIVSSVEDLAPVRANALIVDGITLAVPSVGHALNTNNIEKTSDQRKEATATVLLCHQVAVVSLNRLQDALGLRQHKSARESTKVVQFVRAQTWHRTRFTA